MKKINLRTGFTLIESLVAVGLFGIIISLAIGGFVKALRTQSQVTALLAANGNASLSIEQMAREIRTGFNFSSQCDNSNTPTHCSLSFTNSNGDSVTYSLVDNGPVESVAKTVNGAQTIFTADNVNVQYLVFYTEGGGPNDEPTRVTVSIGVAPAGNIGDISVTRIQTTVSARQG